MSHDASLNLPPAIQSDLQDIVDLMAQLVDVPTGLIMRVVGPEIEVAVTSRTEGNPYRAGHREHLVDSGLYCETVMRTRKQLLVSDALISEEWRDNPDVKLGMISYLGFPICLPDGSIFGTICLLDNKPNAHTDTSIRLMEKFRSLTERHLELLFMNATLGDENRQLGQYIEEIRAMRQFIPICATASPCATMRTTGSRWRPISPSSPLPPSPTASAPTAQKRCTWSWMKRRWAEPQLPAGSAHGLRSLGRCGEGGRAS